uniref:Uncharacterized protein n=1 Tax=Nelumbo nucifera TaxID=4432 RepID=A0A822ZID5_NELNU|nr:TPA_asm: hypothetical protein HUJ06_015771 [Nelumbo nucifera]
MATNTISDYQDLGVKSVNSVRQSHRRCFGKRTKK